MLVTLCARSKILHLLDEGKAFRIQTCADTQPHVDLIPNSDVAQFDSTITCVPLIVADIQTVTLMAGRTIDFDYKNDEFIIST